MSPGSRSRRRRPAGPAGPRPRNAPSRPVPNPSDQLPVAAQQLLDEAYPRAAAHTGMIWADFQTTIAQADKEIAALESTRARASCARDVYNVLGEANWTPFAVSPAAKPASSSSEFVGDAENAALLQQALQEIGYQPEVLLHETNMYDQNFLEAGGPAVDGSFVRHDLLALRGGRPQPGHASSTSIMLDAAGRARSPSSVCRARRPGCSSRRSPSSATSTARSPAPASSNGPAKVTEWDGGGLHATGQPGRQRRRPAASSCSGSRTEVHPMDAPTPTYACRPTP